jgi:hypothetical protein
MGTAMNALAGDRPSRESPGAGAQSEIMMSLFKMRMTGNSPIIFLFTPSD